MSEDKLKRAIMAAASRAGIQANDMVRFVVDYDNGVDPVEPCAAVVTFCEYLLAALTARSEGFRDVLEEALTRMDRAREILRGPNANWGMLDTGDLRRTLSPRETDEGYANAHPRELDAPASAPSSEVAEMVKRLRAYANESGGARVEQDLLRAAALLAKVGQGQGPAAINWTTEGCPKHHGQPWTFTATAYTELGKRCPLCNPPPPERP